MNPEPIDSNSYAELTDLGLLRIEGKDAERFLQGQLSNNVSALHIGQAQWTAYHSPKGRVLAVGVLCRQADEIFAWSLARALTASTQEKLRRFVLRSSVTISNQSKTHRAIGLIVHKNHSRSEDATHWLKLPLLQCSSQNHSSEIVTHEHNNKRFIEVWFTADKTLSLLKNLQPISVNEYRLEANIKSNVVWLQPETADQFTAHMLNLDQIGAVSFTKGCYVGQEIVARTEHLGRVKRRLSYIQRDNELNLPPMSALTDSEYPEKKIGDVIYAVSDQGKTHIQVVSSTQME